jgi:hypothetical protein
MKTQQDLISTESQQLYCPFNFPRKGFGNLATLSVEEKAAGFDTRSGTAAQPCCAAVPLRTQPTLTCWVEAGTNRHFETSQVLHMTGYFPDLV